MDNYDITLESLSLSDYSLIDANDSVEGKLHLELSNLSPTQNRDSMIFDFGNENYVSEQLKVYYSSYDEYNQIVAQGFEFLSTAPDAYNLAQSYPNPFTLPSGTTIEFDMPSSERASMVIIDIRGRIVRTLIDNEIRFGYQSIVWDGSNDDGDLVSNGVYFYQIRTKSFTEAGKLVLLK